MSRFQCFIFFKKVKGTFKNGTWEQLKMAKHMITSQILKFVDFTKTQKSRYLENKALFFPK